MAIEQLPPYTVVEVSKPHVLIVKDRDGVWLPAGVETWWMEADEEVFDRFPEAQIVARPS